MVLTRENKIHIFKPSRNFFLLDRQTDCLHKLVKESRKKLRQYLFTLGYFRRWLIFACFIFKKKRLKRNVSTGFWWLCKRFQFICIFLQTDNCCKNYVVNLFSLANIYRTHFFLLNTILLRMIIERKYERRFFPYLT